MDNTWGVPVPQSVMAPGYAQYQQYPQSFTGYEQYYMGYPWNVGSYAPMYPYMTGGYQQMSYYPTKEEEVCEPPAAKRARIDSKVEMPNPRDVDAHLSDISHGNETILTEGCPTPDIDFPFDKTLSHDRSLPSGPMTSTLAKPLPPLEIEISASALSVDVPTPPVSPILQINTSSFSLKNTYAVSEHHLDHLTVHQTTQEQPIAPIQFDASQVMVMLPDGTKSSLWDQQVPAAFAAYQQPSPYAVPTNGAPGPSRRRRGPRAGNQVGGRTKNNHCHLCDQSYESSYKLKLHMNSHTGERPFVCEICGKGFVRGPNLNAHRRVHTGEKPYSCNRCGRGFSHPTDRIVHMVTEVCIRAERYIRRTGQGWECVSCESGSFESREMADRHARQHETGKGLSCPVCKINYQGQKAHVLIKHVRECHPEYMDNLQ